jgi:RNA polymerase sigma-70 factor, ECF subfamily
MQLRGATYADMTRAVALELPFAPVEHVRDDARSLVGRLRAGDVAALGEAYDAHHAHMHSFARRLLGDDAAAADLTQDTFMALGDAIKRFSGDASLRTFLVSIAVNRARHHVRAAARRRSATVRFGEAPQAPMATPEDELERSRLAATLTRALDALPLDQRVAFVLCDVEERTSVEVAAIVGASETTVRARVWHARRKIRELFAKEELR